MPRLLSLAFSGMLVVAAPIGAQVHTDDDLLSPLTVPADAIHRTTLRACTAEGCTAATSTQGSASTYKRTVDYFQREYFGEAQRQYTAGRLGASAYTGPGEPGMGAGYGWASAAAGWGDFFAVENTTSELRWKTINLYVHGVLSGVSATVTGDFRLWQQVGSSWLLVGEQGAVLRGQGERQKELQFRVGVAAPVGSSDSETTFFFLESLIGASVGSYSCYPYTCYEYGHADGMNTASVYIPAEEGLKTYTSGGWLTQQERPVWASQTTVPEPASVALLGTALGALGIGAQLRRRRARIAA